MSERRSVYSPHIEDHVHREYAPSQFRMVCTDVKKVNETGGSGVVYSGMYKGPKKEVEIKCAIKFLKTNSEMRDNPVRWLKELGLLKHTLMSVHSPFLLGVEDIVYDDELGFGVVSPWAEYGDLANDIKTFPADGQMIASVGMQTALALSELHENDIVHRDLKPENIFVDRQGRKKKFREFKVGDFGLAATLEYLKKPKYRGKDDWATAKSMSSITDLWDDRLTPVLRTMGTPSYMSPEQASGGPLDARTDLFSLGSILFELIAHVPPFQGHDNFDLMMNIANVWFYPASLDKFKSAKLSFLSPDQETRLKDIIFSLLVKNVSQRGMRSQGAQMQSAADVARAIVKLWDGNNSEPITQTREFQMARSLQ